MEIPAFLAADTPMFGEGLIMLHPYQAGRIPVVLIHGTASSPARWAEMLNEPQNDSVLRDHIQFWLFMYNTGNPILLSAKRLRDALTNVVKALDPDARDPALHRMVLIGHSQGGLLARLMVTDSGDRFWGNVSRVRLSELKMSSQTRELLEGGFFFEPLPFVNQVVFIATPHQGSFRAAGVVRTLVRRLVRLPITLLEDLTDAARQNPDVLTSHGLEGLTSPRTAVDDMSPGTPLVRTLSASPIAPGVEVHWIIAVRGKGPLREQTDGPVE
jgi:pimeloyl-ACP methyl ester carboxylesterase